MEWIETQFSRLIYLDRMHRIWWIVGQKDCFYFFKIELTFLKLSTQIMDGKTDKNSNINKVLQEFQTLHYTCIE